MINAFLSSSICYVSFIIYYNVFQWNLRKVVTYVLISYVACRILRNEYDPSFSVDNYTATISETHPVGQVVLTVQATDDDEIYQGTTPNSQITYSIDPTDTDANR